MRTEADRLGTAGAPGADGGGQAGDGGSPINRTVADIKKYNIIIF
jgi:hypothetical protein